MEQSVLTSKDIVKIIEACALQGVTSFCYGTLKIEFGANPIAIQNSPNPDIPSDSAKDESVLEKTAEEAIDQAEIELKNRQLSELMIEDPAEFERLQALGELDDVSVEDQP